ncbi:alpha/beta fold hydrolase [Nocardioides endophyticus]|uniref:Alpha/beta fold hydrolase n=1 Tax=Nocardioides endophyticus TaxID=1353775 RepID=A0ABP8YF72_9ACTN
MNPEIDEPISARSHYVEVSGLRTHYLEGGEGPTLILLHDGGFGGSGAATWYRNFDAFASRFHVIAPDWLGFGRTAKVHDFEGGRARRLWHMTRFLEEIGVDAAAFAGVSMGATLLLQVLASKEQDWPVQAAVAISGGGFMPNNAARQSMVGFDGTRESMRALVRAMTLDPRWENDPNLLDRRLHDATQPGAWEAVAAARFKSPVAAEPEGFGGQDRTPYEDISVPTLLIAGADDALREPGYADDVARRVPHCELHVLSRCGHMANIEQAEQVNDLVLEFLVRTLNPGNEVLTRGATT